jgi:trehalose 6-phosphate synthase/phosphatase
VAALAPLADRLHSLWIGWSGDPSEADDPQRRALLEDWQRDHGFVAVDLEPAVARGFYDGYSNATLWPLLHGFPDRVELEPRTWAAYRTANERFADAVVRHHRPGDLVWVHDYQLALVPELVRRRIPDARIGLFFHVPFPASEIFRILPDREAYLRGLLGADLLGFQTQGHVHDFRRTTLEVLGHSSRLDQIELDGRSVTLEALPIGIVTSEWERLLEDRRVQARIRDRLRAKGDRKLILAVDRLDYTKGIPERLRAFRELLRRKPEWRGRVQLVQVAVPSRERVPRYAELRSAVSELVGEINGELASADWSPVVYMRRTIPQQELAALYATADVAWVAPLRDGMNLVAKEFVACQAGRGGVLVLSEFAGAAQELGEALRVNPYDIEGSVESVERALVMPAPDRHLREAALLDRIRRNDAVAWSARFLDALRAAVSAREPTGEATASSLPESRVLAAAASARHRTFYLDYDGSLVAIAPRPADAIPTPEALDVLQRLSADPDNRVVVLSGRPSEELEAWFGGFARLWLVAEHGALMRNPDDREWQPFHPGADARWKDRVRPILQHVVDRAPGSFLEEKRFGLAWHYRLAEPEFAEFLAAEVASLLEQQLAGTDLVVMRGRKVIEVRYAWANKGEAAWAIRSAAPPATFELALGDDRTDEDLFERLPPKAWTIKVGRGQSRARFRVAGPEDAVRILGLMASESADRPVRTPRRTSRSRSAVAASGVASRRRARRTPACPRRGP